MKKLLFFLLAFSLAGCASIDRQVFKARQIFDKYPNEAAKYCGDKFPVADSTVSIKTDTIKGKAIDYTPALNSLQMLLDSAKGIAAQKQSKVTGLAGQLSFANTQLSNANRIINSLSVQICTIKAGYKPCGVDTIRSAYTTIRSNTAKITALTDQIVQDGQDKAKMQNNLQYETTTAAHRLYWIIGLSLLIASYFAVKIYTFFSGGAIVNTLFH
ncbi:MAG: hypothetical protein ACHQIM_10330 [Sphingobacteriales bacterium]